MKPDAGDGPFGLTVHYRVGRRVPANGLIGYRVSQGNQEERIAGIAD